MAQELIDFMSSTKKKGGNYMKKEQDERCFKEVDGIFIGTEPSVEIEAEFEELFDEFDVGPETALLW